MATCEACGHECEVRCEYVPFVKGKRQEPYLFCSDTCMAWWHWQHRGLPVLPRVVGLPRHLTNGAADTGAGPAGPE